MFLNLEIHQSIFIFFEKDQYAALPGNLFLHHKIDTHETKIYTYYFAGGFVFL